MKNSSRFEPKNGEELETFEERPARVARLIEDASIELEPGELTVHVELAAAARFAFAHRLGGIHAGSMPKHGRLLEPEA